MSILDHAAFRVNRKNHDAAIKMLVDLFGYEVADEFPPEFADGTSQGTKCTVLTPKGCKNAPRQVEVNGIKYQLPPDLFVSSSDQDDSIVAKWVDKRSGIGGLHHLAMLTDNVDKTMEEFKAAGFEFLTNKPIECPELTQTFTKPSDLLGVIFEFLERRSASFCKSSVGNLMSSTQNCD